MCEVWHDSFLLLNAGKESGESGNVGGCIFASPEFETEKMMVTNVVKGYRLSRETGEANREKEELHQDCIDLSEYIPMKKHIPDHEGRCFNPTTIPSNRIFCIT